MRTLGMPIMTNDLPEFWLPPFQITQRSMFPRSLEEWLARAKLSKDEIRAWRQLGWISFDVDCLVHLDDPEFYEVIFVRNIARSGIPFALISEMLSKLPKPYSYDPILTAFSFAH